MKQITTFFSGSARVLKSESIMDVVQDIANNSEKDDPFYVMDVGDIVQKIKTWKLKMPRVKPFYAMKCNDNTTLLEILSALGTGFDCASKNEMKKIISLGIDPSRIIFAHPCKPASHIREASKLGVDLMTFDNITELGKVKEIMPNARLVLRIRCDAEEAQCALGIKFGVYPEYALPLLVAAKKLGLNVVGVCFHVGSGCQEPQVFLRAIKASREVFDQAIALGFEPYLLDIGGGFPGTEGSTLDELAHYINMALEEHFPHDVEIIAEPGRYVAASAFTLATQVISKRQVETKNDSPTSFMYYINDGVYGSFNCIFYDHQVVSPKVFQQEHNTNQALLSSSIWGPTCDGLDQILSDTPLPELDLGDWMIWSDMGAYTVAAAGTFNGFPVPPVYVVVPFHTWLFLEGLLSSSSFALNNALVDAVDGIRELRPQSPISTTTTVRNIMNHFHEDQNIDLLVDHINTILPRAVEI